MMRLNLRWPTQKITSDELVRISHFLTTLQNIRKAPDHPNYKQIALALTTVIFSDQARVQKERVPFSLN